MDQIQYGDRFSPEHIKQEENKAGREKIPYESFLMPLQNISPTVYDRVYGWYKDGYKWVDIFRSLQLEKEELEQRLSAGTQGEDSNEDFIDDDGEVLDNMAVWREELAGINQALTIVEAFLLAEHAEPSLELYASKYTTAEKEFIRQLLTAAEHNPLAKVLWEVYASQPKRLSEAETRGLLLEALEKEFMNQPLGTAEQANFRLTHFNEVKNIIDRWFPNEKWLNQS